MRFPALALAAALLAVPAVRGQAQQQAGSFEPVDRIVAVVGTTAILMSQLEEELNIMQREGLQMPQDPGQVADLMRQVLEQMVQTELLVQAARQDTLVQVSDQQVQSSVDDAIRRIRSQFASENEFRRQLALAGFGTPEEYRQTLIEQRRREMLVQTLLQSLQQRDEIRPVPPTEAELRAYFEATVDQQPQRPATVSFRLIVVRPEAARVADSVARAEADSLRAQLTRGGDFAALARRFSDDSASAVQGGELGWLRRGATVREFEQVIFGIRPGSISQVFRSPYGYHVAQVQRAEPSEVQVRHILVAPEITEADRQMARDTAAAIARALEAGARFDSLQRVHHDDNEQSLFDGVARTDLYQSMQEAIAEAQPAQVIGPFLITEGGRSRWGVVRFEEQRSEGEYTFAELRDPMRNELARQNMVARFVATLRAATYVDVRL